ncbi:MAG: FAD-binding oxidoreductase [Desulfobacula sp.]|nr:FAD-binding oxidoreductase [Desulfobacula sp.]
MACPIHQINDRYMDCLKDESRISGQAETISFPGSEADVLEIVRTMSNCGIPITVQGSRTGITGGGVPTRGHILNLSKMNKITGLNLGGSGKFSIMVQPGISLLDLNLRLREKRFNTAGWDEGSLVALERFKTAARQFWPPDPTETTASIGGIAANNARGICAYRYGSAQRHIKSIRIVDAGARIYKISKGQYCFEEGICPLPGGDKLQLDPSIFSTRVNNDLLDLYLGSEGMLGAIIELELALEPQPQQMWGVVFFFTAQCGAAGFIQAVMSKQKTNPDTQMAAIEFMDQHTLDNIYTLRRTSSTLKVLPDLENQFVSAVLLEIHSDQIQKVEALSEWLMTAAERFDCDPDKTWAFCNENEMERFRLFRHAAPESANVLIDKVRTKDPRISKLGSDMQFAGHTISKQLEMFQNDLKLHGLKAAIFGHAGDGLLHVNILPEDYPQYIKAKKVMEKWASHIHSKGGSVVTEHGIGKVKKHLFKSNPLPQHMEIIFKLKGRLDPNGLWNPGNIRD